MSNRDIFTKHLPNVKLATRYDADGKEIQVERREDVDATAREEETFDMLVAAGYYRAKIKGLPSFDKIVGGMTWCIECCDYDVDVDLLFHENLTIGQKIALVEKIVSVLPIMKCPFLIEPHQIQGLEFLSIHPVIQWLVKKSVENRAERSQKLKNFAIGQFHNHYQYQTDLENLKKIRSASKHIKHVQGLYSPCHQYRCKNVPKEGCITVPLRVCMTLSEYGVKTEAITDTNIDKQERAEALNENLGNEIDVNHSLKNISLAEEDIITLTGPIKTFDVDAHRNALHKHYSELMQEMETDTKALSERSQLKNLEVAAIKLREKVERSRKGNNGLELEVERQQHLLQSKEQTAHELVEKIEKYKRIESTAKPELLDQVQAMLKQHDALKKEEVEFKEHCRQDLAKLQHEVEELEVMNARDPAEQAVALEKEKKHVQELKLQLAKRNRGIVAIQRQLDSIPDRTELAQYQRRFHELYNEISAKHLETKQYYTLYNTLNDKKRYLEKELSLLNSICEAYIIGMQSAHGREEFLVKFEAIVEGVQQTLGKVKRKYSEELMKREGLNEELQALLALQHQYAAAVKQLTKECQRCEQLQQHLKSIN